MAHHYHQVLSQEPRPRARKIHFEGTLGHKLLGATITHKFVGYGSMETRSRFPLPLLYLCGTAGLRKRVPSASMKPPIRSAIPWSNPRSRIDLTMTVVSIPRPVRKPGQHTRKPDTSWIFRLPSVSSGCIVAYRPGSERCFFARRRRQKKYSNKRI